MTLIEFMLRDGPRRPTVGIGLTAQANHELKVGDQAASLAVPMADPRLEPVGYYRTSKLQVVGRAVGDQRPAPPWLTVPPPLPATAAIDSSLDPRGPSGYPRRERRTHREQRTWHSGRTRIGSSHRVVGFVKLSPQPMVRHQPDRCP